MKFLLFGLIGALVFGWSAWYRRREQRREVARINGYIKEPRYIYKDHDDTLRVAAEERRVNAEELRRRAALVDSGGVALREVRRRA